MNYDEARSLKDGGWHWTTMNDGQVRTATPCLRNEGPPLSMSGPAVLGGNFKRCEPHATREEAERHFYDHCLSELTEHTWSGAERCEAADCDTWTNVSLGARGLSSCFRNTYLCDEHRTRKMVAQLHPFETGISLMHS